MKLIHLTVKRFQHLTADSVYIYNLATEFNKCLKGSYVLIIGNKFPEQFQGINLVNLRLRSWSSSLMYFWFPYVYSFFWLPFYILRQKNKISDLTFFSSDINLLLILIWWKKVFRFKFKICSDWHMLVNHFKDHYVANNSEYLITTSEKLKISIVNKFHVNPRKIKIVYGGVDLSIYQSLSEGRLELGLPEDKILIGYIGLFKTMGMEKGIDTMIESLKYLDHDVVMVFVGAKSGQVEKYINLAKKIKIENQCLFIEVQPTKKIPAYERAMDILVIPYPDKPHFRDFGFPMKVYEYMASKKPIIYSKLDLVEEVVRDCSVGFEAGNAKDLAQKIIEINRDNKFSTNLVNRAYKKVQEYTWQKKTKKIIDFIKIIY